MAPDTSSWVTRQLERLSEAWRRGEMLSAAEVINQAPQIGDEDALRLIYEEVCLRREAGEKVRTSEVLSRHPRLRGPLRALLECDRLLRPFADGSEFPEPGEVLGPFKLVAELGRGASGRTYVATDPNLADRPVVLKVISGEQDEHLALASLRHTHIIPLFSEHTFIENDLRGLCMPYLGGTSLAAVLKEMESTPVTRRTGRMLIDAVDRLTPANPAPPAIAGPFRRGLQEVAYTQAIIWIAACLADALQYAHERGLVHMDVKPSNVLIAADGQPMLLDFHLARPPIAAGTSTIERLGGTPGWMAPEQAAALEAVRRGEPVTAGVDGRADIYALGLLLRGALGMAPDARRGAERGASNASAALLDLVRKCLAIDPRQRYTDAATLADDLRRQLNDLPLRGVRNRSMAERLGKWRRRHPGALAWSITGLALLLVAAVAATSWWADRAQHRANAAAALESGRRLAASDDYSGAIETYQHALAQLEGVAGVGDDRAALKAALRRTGRLRVARELHEVSDTIRFRYGVDLPARSEAETLEGQCKRLWNRRHELTSDPQLEPDLENGIATDLLELAAVRADLLAGVEGRVGEADQVLEEAERSFGSHFALSIRRAQNRGDLAQSPVPRTPWEHYDLGRYLLRRGEFGAAAAEFHAALQGRPSDFWSNFYEGLCRYRLKHWSEAEAAFRVCVALSPKSAAAHYNQALALQALGRANEARAAYDRALKLDPTLVEARLNRGSLAYQQQRFTDALTDFERALADAPERATRGRLHLNAALAERAMGNHAAAATHVRQAADLGVEENASPRVGDR